VGPVILGTHPVGLVGLGARREVVARREAQAGVPLELDAPLRAWTWPAPSWPQTAWTPRCARPRWAGPFRVAASQPWRAAVKLWGARWPPGPPHALVAPGTAHGPCRHHDDDAWKV